MNDQIKPRCPYFGVCGGCQLQDVPYDEQLVLKRQAVERAFSENGVEGIQVNSTWGMSNPWFYRNKVQFPIRSQNGQLIMGYFKKGTHEVVSIKECYIQDPFLTEIAKISLKIIEDRGLTAYDEVSGKGLVRHFIGRSSFITKEMLLGIVINAKGMPASFTLANEIKKQERLMHRQVGRQKNYPEFDEKRRIVGIIQNANVYKDNVILGEKDTKLLGSSFFMEMVGGFKFRIGLHSFFQVNPVQAKLLYKLVKKYADLTGEELVIDAYAGISPIALFLSDKAKQIIGVEEVASAVKDAQENILLNKLYNIQMVLGQIEKDLPKKADVIILDPPRAGCSEKALRAVIKVAPRRIIYVSCNPKTLARDLKALIQNSYKIDAVQPIDMFPQTDHVETVVKLTRAFS
ncbi:MAG: 23S rRNA (uracil(1939)-C(5))-methyltransferase RlmD [Candidatus Margulisiibacteriota bacterium]